MVPLLHIDCPLSIYLYEFHRPGANNPGEIDSLRLKHLGYDPSEINLSRETWNPREHIRNRTLGLSMNNLNNAPTHLSVRGGLGQLANLFNWK